MTARYSPWSPSGLFLTPGALWACETVVTFSLTPTDAGTHVRMEQSGFRPDQETNYKGAKYGWKKFMGNLEQVVAGLE